MKKIIALLLAVTSIVTVFAGCSGEKNEETSKAETTTAETTTEAKIDLDLTQLSSTVVYSEVYNMMLTPDDYRGKKVKMKGAFTYAKDNDTNKYYYACIIADATQCCQQGLEFVLTEEKPFEEYPALNTEIEVVGEFDTYNEGEMQFCYLKNASMKLAE